MSGTYTFSYTRTHTATFVSDNMRNVLRDLIRELGLSPENLLNSWGSGALGRAVKTWLETGDLTKIIIEFYRPGSNTVVARWDFPIQYDGSGIDDDMWVSKSLILNAIRKSTRPPKDALYDILLTTNPGRPDVDGMTTTPLRSTDGLICRSSGTAIATPDIMAGLNYWRAA